MGDGEAMANQQRAGRQIAIRLSWRSENATETPQVLTIYYCKWTWAIRGTAGTGARIRTEKGFRPEICGVSAFTDFATPAPLLRLTNLGKLDADDAGSNSLHQAALQFGGEESNVVTENAQCVPED